MRILYIQYAGDFSEAYQRLYVNGGSENYYGQKYSVDAVVDQAIDNVVEVIVLHTAEYHHIELKHNLTVIGLGKGQTVYQNVFSAISEFSPDKVILRMPDVKVLKFLRKAAIPTLPVFADSFEFSGVIRGRLYRYQLAKELRNSSVQWVANHQINASISLEKLGINSKKILPYDWEHSDSPKSWSKEIASDFENKEIVVFFAGSVSKAKGVFELVSAIKFVKEHKRKVKVKIAGQGEVESLVNFAQELGVRDNVEFLGLINHTDVLNYMNKADVVVTPSHHSYPEGLPMTIMESLMVHTPVIASDHPMFVGRVGNRGAVIFFKEKSGEDLAKKIIFLCGDSDAYKKRCINAPLEWADLNLKLKWADMINCWLKNPFYDFIESSLHSIKNKR